MKRVTVFNASSRQQGVAMAVKECDEMDDLVERVKNKLNLTSCQLLTPEGGVIDDLDLVRDNDILLAATENASSSPLRVLTQHPNLVTDLKVISPGGKRLPSPVKVISQSLTLGNDLKAVVFGSDWVNLNVGGTLFTTTRSTLTAKEPESMLARMFASDEDHIWKSSVDGDGAFLIDRSPHYFKPILEYLRHGELIMDAGVNAKGVLEEAKFFGISSLVERLEAQIKRDTPPNDHTPFSRREFTLKLMNTPSNCELRCQGLNFDGADLSKLDLRYINFKYAHLHNTNFTGANLSYCNFERADLSKAKLDGANLLGVKMLCVNLEGATAKGCNFEDPAGSRANMEGANMKQVNLEGSHMAGVNLRVATLKNANLQNCDLRGAVLAGTDLENCDLSGCDLQEANLRGANLKGAAFELMLNPLHMSQTVR